MKVIALIDKFAAKYAEDTMRVPSSPEMAGEKPINVVEVPPAPKVPSFDAFENKPSYDDLVLQRKKPLPPDRAVQFLLNRCSETELFTPEEMTDFQETFSRRGPKAAFREIINEVQRRMFAAETCLQAARNYGQYIQ